MASLDPQSLVEAIVSRLQAAYTFPDRAAEAERLLRANLAAGMYAPPVEPASVREEARLARAEA